MIANSAREKFSADNVDLLIFSQQSYLRLRESDRYEQLNTKLRAEKVGPSHAQKGVAKTSRIIIIATPR